MALLDRMIRLIRGSDKVVAYYSTGRAGSYFDALLDDVVEIMADSVQNTASIDGNTYFWEIDIDKLCEEVNHHRNALWAGTPQATEDQSVAIDYYTDTGKQVEDDGSVTLWTLGDLLLYLGDKRLIHTGDVIFNEETEDKARNFVDRLTGSYYTPARIIGNEFVEVWDGNQWVEEFRTKE